MPLLYASLLRNASALRGSLGLLVGGYRPEAAAWELVAVAEKLVLVGFLSLLQVHADTFLTRATIIAD